MKLVLLNHSDSKGGASVATMRLFDALRGLGVDAKMLVMHKTTDSPDIDVLQPTWRRKASFVYEHAYIYLHNGFSRQYLFRASPAVSGMRVHNHPWVKDADIVVLGWINQGMLSLDEIAKIPKPVVWIMHDMWCLTGVCHHAYSCRRYTGECGNCPLAWSGRFAHDMSWSTNRRKAALYKNQRISFVAVSTWLAERCKESSLLSDADVTVITNPFDTDSFSTEPKKGREAYGLPMDKRLVIMGAARLDDPIKGLSIAVDALNRLETDGNVAAVFFGDIRQPQILQRLRIPYIHVGPVGDPDTLNDLYAHSDVVLSTSHYESLGLTLIEGMAAGCVPVTFGTGGQTDVVSHRDTGYIASYPDAADVAAGIRYALSGTIDRGKVRQSVADTFGSVNVALRYMELFDELLSREDVKS